MEEEEVFPGGVLGVGGGCWGGAEAGADAGLLIGGEEADEAVAYFFGGFLEGDFLVG